ncbi:MAG: ATP-binding protein [Clostridiales Family XIII bacterium]|nr:ATP-binding protein [Clostridiales Family XIII bacterium]
MVKLIVGQKGTGKTKRMIALANERIGKSDGSVVFINKNHRLMYDLKYMIRVVCMEDYEEITNSDEYIGFIFGIISSDHDIEAIFIDSILKHADVSTEDIPEFLDRLSQMGEKYEIEFIVSLSAQPGELGEAISRFEVLS